MVKYFGKPEIEGKNLKKHIAISSDPANILAIEYTGLEVLSKSNNKANVPFIVKALGKKQETSEEEVRKSTVTQRRIENVQSPQWKRSKILSPPDVSSSRCHTNVAFNSLLPYKLPIHNFSIFKVYSSNQGGALYGV